MLLSKDSIVLFLNSNRFTGTEEEFISIKEFDFKEWTLNDWYHRINGPAVIYSDGRKYWYIDGLNFYDFFDQFFPVERFARDKYPGE